MLRRLRAQAKGALAIVSGRSLESLTTVVTESSLDLVSEHGAAFRLQNVESTVAGLGFPFGGEHTDASLKSYKGLSMHGSNRSAMGSLFITIRAAQKLWL